jgi:signal transduction histidine kinase
VKHLRLQRHANTRHATHDGPQHRHWHHRLRHSLRWRLVTVFLLLALAMSLAFVGGTRKAFAVGWREAVRPLLADYVDRLVADLGSPPEADRARALVARLPISVRIEGPLTQFDSHPQRQAELWRDGEHGMDDDSRSLLRRKTPDGHVISFGTGSLEWHRGPGVFAWVTLAALLGLTGLAFAYVRRLLKPLDDIGAGAQRFGAGDFAEPIVVRRHDELGDLAGQINTMGQDIHQMLEAKRALLLAISHELRSPLTRARLNTELLPDTPDTQAARDALLRDLAEMGRLIADLLESERLSGNHAPLNLALTDLGRLVQDGVADMEADMAADAFANVDAGVVAKVDAEVDAEVQAGGDAPSAKSQARFAVTVAADLPMLQLDAVRIRLLLRNLLDNAVRHSPNNDQSNGLSSGPPAQAAVEVDLRRQTDAAGGHEVLHLCVRDHGPGVAPEQLSHLAEPFFRVDAGRQRSTGGVGLGLYLCRLVAQAHGGSLQVRNALPGLEVTVSLPL